MKTKTTTDRRTSNIATKPDGHYVTIKEGKRFVAAEVFPLDRMTDAKAWSHHKLAQSKTPESPPSPVTINAAWEEHKKWLFRTYASMRPVR